MVGCLLGHRIAAINEEAVALAMSSFIAKTTATEVLELIDCLLVQGTNERDAYREYFPDAATRIAVTGNPRADFLGPELRYCHDKNRDEIRAVPFPPKTGRLFCSS